MHASEDLRSAFQKTKTLQVSVKGPVLYGFSPRAKFYGINIRSELDAPGEYYLDRSPGSSTFGTLFFWPPSGLHASEAFVSFGDYTLVLGGTAAGLEQILKSPLYSDFMQ